MFCLDATVKEKLFNAATFRKSKSILGASKYDPVIHIRLSGVSDLIAAEGKYHNSCYQRFSRRASKTQKSANEGSTVAMEWLMAELKDSARKAQVLDLSEVWIYYCELAQQANEEIPQSFHSRRSTFKDKLQSKIADIYDCVPLQAPERQVLLIPKEYANIPFSKLVYEEQEEPLHIPKYQASEEFLEVMHVALKLHSDVLSHPEYKGFVVNEEKMITSVPESLFVFLRLIFGGQDLLEEDPDEDDPYCDHSSQKEAKTQTRILSLAQDIVYNLTGGKH